MSERLFEEVADASPALMWVADADNRCYWFNARWLAFTGRTLQQEVGMGWLDNIHPDDVEACLACYGGAFARREAYRTEYRRKRHDGAWRLLDARGAPRFVDGRFAGFIGSCIDITDQRNAMRALEAHEEQLRRLNETLEERISTAVSERQVYVDIIESTDALIQVLDRDFRILAVNRSLADHFERLYGVRPRLGDRLLELIEHAPAERALIESYWSRALNGEEFTVVDEFGDDSRARRYHEIKFNALRDAGGEIVGAFQFVYDVTDRLRDQVRLAEAESQLRQAQKIEALGQLTGGVAHDFNNLLMVISGGLSLLERAKDDERRRRLMERMRQAADRGSSLSRQLLTFARRQSLKPQPVDIRSQLGTMRELLDRTLRADVQVKTEFATDLWSIHVDPAEFELVMLNLCVNARDAMPGGGVITIRARNAHAIQDPHLSGDFVEIAVTDSGTGMSAEVLAHIFEPFFTTKELGKGSGLGLPQVYGFTQQSGGRVKVESTPNLGTTVTLWLPRTQAAAAILQIAPPPPEPGARRGGRVLLVEDDDEVAALVGQLLQELGHQVLRVATADAALGALADDRPIDLVFSDIMMPGSMNGVALAEEIRARRASLPVLLTTGYGGASVSQAKDAGIPVLLKPYQLEALAAAIEQALADSVPSARDIPSPGVDAAGKIRSSAAGYPAADRPAP